MDDENEKMTNGSPNGTNGEIDTPAVDAIDEDELARRELARIMPSKEQLRAWAAKHPPPPEYFEGDEEIPFDPVETCVS